MSPKVKEYIYEVNALMRSISMDYLKPEQQIIMEKIKRIEKEISDEEEEAGIPA